MNLRLAALLVLLLGVTEVPAVSVRTWGPASADAFARGTLEGTCLDDEGWLTLAPAASSWWGPGGGIVWDIAADAERGAFVALSGPARVLHVLPGKPPETWFEQSGDAMVTALAPDGRGGVYFALSPEGRILHVRAAGQTAQPRFTTEARYVWALALAGDRLWAGTGSPGLLLRGKADGSMETITATGEDPVRALTALPGGGVAAGTGRRGRVLRVGADGVPFALLDADEDEIVDLAAGGEGDLWVLTARDRGRTRASRPASDEARPPADAQEGKPASSPEPDPDEPPSPPAQAPPADEARPPASPRVGRGGGGSAGTASGALYRIDVQGGVTRLWESATDVPYALALLAGTPVVGTGEAGRLLRVDRRGAAAPLQRFPSDQVTALAVSPGGRLLAAGSNDARVAALGPETAATGTWVSDVFDAGTVADWGISRWDGARGGGGVEVALRAGNTGEPDGTWSAWRSVRSGEVASVPAARFVQARLELRGSGGAHPRVRRLEVAYRTKNRGPRIRKLDVESPGIAVVSQPASGGTSPGPLVADDPVAQRTARASGRRPTPGTRRLYEAGARSATWEASDPDDDTLRYTLELRAVGDGTWRELARDLETSFYAWDSRGTPDGLYELRLTASDGEDNSQGSARTDERVSDPFTIDHTAPHLESLQVSSDGKRVTFVALDPGGRVAAVEVAAGASPWRRVAPEDGIEDGERERYAVELPSGEPLRLRVTDAAGNLGGGETVPAPAGAARSSSGGAPARR
ncbi:MAG TPA: hypothetical protein VFV75_19135 [Candidatus Polarisedimenticolaceae bacterium]|nr:hypothetical protein [Candidatus Polarisedimenticolaceae bacterium]